MRLAFILPAAVGLLMSGHAVAQVFYPQPEAVLIGPMPNVQDNLDMSVEFDAFTTNWGEGYTGVSVGTEADIALSPGLTLGLEGRRIDSNLGEAYEYGAGLTIHGEYGELYAAINGVSAMGDIPDLESGTWVEVGGDFQLGRNLWLGFEASVPVDSAVVPYEAIYGSGSSSVYR